MAMYFGISAIVIYLSRIADAQSTDPEVTIFPTTPSADVSGIVHAKSGTDVTFTCQVENQPQGTTVRWHLTRRGQTRKEQLTSGESVIDSFKYGMNRELNRWTLKVMQVTNIDEGNYSCELQISLQIRIRDFIQLNIGQPPKIIFSASSNDRVILPEGQHLTLTCKATGDPMPNITWTRETGTKISAPVDSVEYMGTELQVYNITIPDNGIYVCTADNGYLPTATFGTRVDVIHGPTIAAARGHYSQVKDQFADVSMECVVNGFPLPGLSWQKLEETGWVSISDRRHKYRIQTMQRPYTYVTWYRLTIHSVTSGDFGIYRCVAHCSSRYCSSTMSTANITLSEATECQGTACSVQPWTFVFLSGRTGRYSTRYQLIWRDDTHARPEAYYITLKQGSNSTAWKEDIGVRASPETGHAGSIYNYTIRDLAPNSAYSLQIRAKNMYGLSEYSQRFYFRTSQDDPTAATPTRTSSATSNILSTLCITFIFPSLFRVQHA